MSSNKVTRGEALIFNSKTKKFKILQGYNGPYKLYQYMYQPKTVMWDGNVETYYHLDWVYRGDCASVEDGEKLAKWLIHGDETIKEFEL